MARNIIIFVADGLRPGSVNAIDTPTLYSIRQNGVNFTNSHSLFPTFTTPNASAIATGHYLGDTGDFSNTVYTGYPIINANGSVTPFIENDPILADINANSNLSDPDASFGKNNFLTEESFLAYARLNGYSTAAIGKLGPVAIFDVTQDTRTGDATTKNITPKTVIIDDSTRIDTIANATNPPVNGVGSQSAVPLSSAIATDLSNAGLIGQNIPGTTTLATTIGSIRNNQSSGNLTTAGTLNPNAQQQQFFADVTTKAVLPQFAADIASKTSAGFAAVYWSRDPDGTQHNNGDAFNAADPGNNSLTIGINGPTAKKGVQDADANLKQIIDYLKATPDPANPCKTLYDNTDIFVTADHGFSTISKQAVGVTFDAAGTPNYINTKSYAASLSYYTTDANGVKTPTVHAGFLPPGFVAIDLAKDLGSTLYDPNQPTVPVTTANINNIQYKAIDPTKGQLTVTGNGVIGGSGKVVSGVIDAGTQVVIAANGGSDLLYVPSNDPVLVKQIVAFLAQKDYISGIFTDDKFGDVPGALKLSTIGLIGTAELPTPSIVINFKTFSTNPNNPNDPQAQVEVADTTLQQGQGMHGSFGRGDTFNNMAAIGPDFKSGYVDNAPVSNVDVVPTLTKILGWTLPSTGTLVGRAITEALVNGTASPTVASTILVSTPVNGVSTILKTQTVGTTPYFDVAGFVGGTDGLIPVTFKPGNLLVSRSVYAGANVKVGDTLPNGAKAIANGSDLSVFQNESVDASFGVTSPIFIDQVTTSGKVLQTLNLTDKLKQQGFDISTSFPSKSELGLTLSPDGAAITFLAYKSPIQALDISNSNTPAVIDNTNPVNALGNLTAQRAVVQFDDNFNLQVTPVNAYSGNNGRNVVLGNNGYYYMVGNAGNGGNISLPTTAIATTANGVTTISNSDSSAFINVVVGQTITGTNIPTTSPVTITSVSADKKSFTISAAATSTISSVKIIQTGATLTDLSNNTGVQEIKAGDTSGNTTVVGVPKGTAGSATGYQNGFAISDAGFTTPDKTGKDDNFRGLTLNPFDNNLYVSKGSGGNGINTVYKVTDFTAAILPTATDASKATITVLPGFPVNLASNGNNSAGVNSAIFHPFGLWFANPTTLYVADEGTPISPTTASDLTKASLDVNAGLEKWTFDGTKWNLKYTLQKGLNLGTSYSVANGANGEVYPTTFNPAISGLRNITGKVNLDGTVSIYGATSTVSLETDQGADPNTIVAITDKLAATSATDVASESFTTIEGPVYGNVYRGVSLAPTVSTPFSGVAAGDASSNDAILWTRTFDSQTKKGVNQNLIAQVSTDKTFATINFTYNVAARTDGLDHDGTAKIDATGLQSGTQYYYRFVTASGSDTSTVGTFKTAPDSTKQSAIRFGFSGDADGLMRPYSSTQTFGSLNLDFFGFLGDTIYETKNNASAAATTNFVSDPAQTLIDYHRKYLENIQPVSNGGFSSLETLFTSQGNYTLLDNHELGNKELINGGAPASLAATQAAVVAGNGSANPADDVNTTGQFINKTVAFKTLEQAYSDYQPIKEKIISAPNDARTDGTQQLYNLQQWSQNLVYINTDTRSYRDVRLSKATGGDDTGSRADNPDRTLLGKTQLAWLKQTLLDAQTNGTVWKFVAVSDPIDQLGAIGSGADGGKSWIGGYRAERNDLLKFIADKGIKNVVFLATDDHQNRINELTYWDNASDIGNQSKAKVLQSVLSVVDGPIGATQVSSATQVIDDHSFSNIKSLADTLASTETSAGVNPIGLDPANFTGLKNVKREGDTNADATTGIIANNKLQAVDFYSPDTFNFTTFDISADGKTLNVNVQGVNSTGINTFPEPTASNPVRSILSFSLDATPVTLRVAASTPTGTETNSVPGVFTVSSDAKVNTDLTFNYTVGGTATNGVDYNKLSGTATISAGQSSVDIAVTPVDDQLPEGTETSVLTLASGSGYNTNAAKALATVSIIDNDLTPVPTSSGNDNLVAIPGSVFDGLSNTVFTGAGDDTVDLAFNPSSANNRVDLGAGNDTIYVSQNDRVFGGDGNDIFDAGDSKGGNRMSGGAGDDTFFLGSGDRALGGDGNDTFFVSSGGNNLLSGGAGADIFNIITGGTPPSAKNTILDFQAGIDSIGIRGGGITFNDLTRSGNDIAYKGSVVATLLGVDTSTLTAANFLFS